jgi:hypothetical protein
MTLRLGEVLQLWRLANGQGCRREKAAKICDRDDSRVDVARCNGAAGARKRHRPPTIAGCGERGLSDVRAGIYAVSDVIGFPSPSTSAEQGAKAYVRRARARTAGAIPV